MKILALALLLLLFASPVASQSGYYWLYVEGAWKGAYHGESECRAAGEASEKPYQCRALGGPKTPPLGSGGWNNDVAYCQAVSGVEAYVSAPGEVKFLGKTTERFDFSRCMTERGHQLK